MKVLAIEGIDGSGKTTICNTLKSYDWGNKIVSFAATPSKGLRSFCMAMRGRNTEASLLSFMIANKAATDDAGLCDVLIIDRYLLSTVVHHYDLSNKWRKELHSIVKTMGAILPSETLFIKCDPSIAYRRLNERSNDSALLIGLDQQIFLYEDILNSDNWNNFVGRKSIFNNENHDDQKVICRYIWSLVQ